MNNRVRYSLVAILAGWFVGTLCTLLLFKLPELWRNAPPNGLVRDLAQGSGLWAGFMLLLCAGIWCVVLLPLLLLIGAETIVRRRLTIAWCASIGATLFIGWRLGTWTALADRGKGHPITALFLSYALFACALSWVTTLVYARLLQRTVSSSVGPRS